MSDKVYTALYPLDFSGYELYENVKTAIENYYYHKFHPGGFVYSLLCNDLVGAVLKVDYWNSQQMKQTVLWLATRMPPAAWGSKEVVDAWLGSEHNAV
jgi:hypothetical protein